MYNSNNSFTNKAGKEKEDLVLQILSKKYNISFYENNVHYDDWGNRVFNQNYYFQNQKYKCPDFYILEDKDGNNIVFRIEVKGFKNLREDAFPGHKTVCIEEEKFKSYYDLFRNEEIDACVLFVIGESAYDNPEFYWETLEGLIKLKSRTRLYFDNPVLCRFWRSSDLNYGLDSLYKYIDKTIENYGW